MKVERVQPKSYIKIVLDDDTAERLCALLGGVDDIQKDKELEHLYCALDDALPTRNNAFSDFFQGAGHLARK